VKVMGGPTRAVRQLDLYSEMLFMWVPQDRSWTSVRSVRRAGRQTVADSKQRLERVLQEPETERAQQLRAIAAESARFNLGFYHDYNIPTLALQFLDPELQPRFSFSLAGQDRIRGTPAWKLAFAKRQSPTVINSDGADLFSAGVIWIRQSDAVVLRTRVEVKAASMETRAGMAGWIVVEYQQNAKLGMWVPVRMEEQYEQFGGNNDLLRCVGTYANFRRFATSTRILP